MRPTLRDPDTVRVGDWLDPCSCSTPVGCRIGTHKNAIVAGVILIISSCGLMYSLRSGATQHAGMPGAVAEGRGVLAVHNEPLALRDGFVDD
jgi:hypothetical protein